MLDENHLVADLGQLEACARTLAEIRQHAAGIRGLAEDANPDWTIWGKLGESFAVVYWEVCAKDLMHQLKMMDEALQGRAQALTATCEAYREAERRITEELAKIYKLLGDEEVRSPWVPPTTVI